MVRMKLSMFITCSLLLSNHGHAAQAAQAAQTANIAELFKGSVFHDEMADKEKLQLQSQKLKALKKLSSINIQDEFGRTPLMYAARGFETTLWGANQEDVTTLYEPLRNEWLTYITQQEPDVNLQDKQGKTALHYAVESGNIPMVEYLLKWGQDLSLKDTDNKIARDYTAINSQDNAREQRTKNTIRKMLDDHAQQFRKSTDAELSCLPERITSMINNYNLNKQQ
jgi:ankyrin repeat protein